MTKTEMIHTERGSGEWTAAVKRGQMIERYLRRKEKHREKKRRLEEQNETLRSMLKLKNTIDQLFP